MNKDISMLGQIFPEAILNEEPSPKSNSRSENKARVDVNLIESFRVKGEDLGVILSNDRKCERYRNPNEDQCVIECLS